MVISHEIIALDGRDKAYDMKMFWINILMCLTFVA